MGPSVTFSGTPLIDSAAEQMILTQMPYAEGETRQQLILFLSDLHARFLPVFRLPPEVLATIFIRSAREYYESDDGGRFTPCIPTWVNVSYVCKRWRNIALNCPTLWAYHFNTSLRWTEELLLRSKRASLKIWIYPYCQDKEVSWWSSLLEKLLGHSERIQELRLDVSPPIKLSLCAPRLEKLEIGFRRRQSIAIIDGDRLPLRELDLYRCSLPWHSLNLSGLETLLLHKVSSPSPLNMVEFLAILSSMQNITVLRLKRVLPSAHSLLSSGDLGDFPKISLPRLAYLSVKAPLSTIIVLLTCVDVPQKAELNLVPLPEPGFSIRDYAPDFFVSRTTLQSTLI